jgi:micrococcal nuclease
MKVKNDVWRRWVAGSTVAVLCLGSSVAAQAGGRPQPWQGRVAQVTDGDTVRVQPARGGPARTIRLDGIDAPEICQAHGPMARDRLAERVEGQQVRVLPRRVDDYGRLLARVEVQDQDVGRWMVRQGYAWSYRYRSQAGPYAAVESQARAQRLGLWQGRPERPRAFRQRHGPCH